MGQFKNKESISPALKGKTARSADLSRERGGEDIAAPYKYLDALGEVTLSSEESFPVFAASLAMSAA